MRNHRDGRLADLMEVQNVGVPEVSFPILSYFPLYKHHVCFVSATVTDAQLPSRLCVTDLFTCLFIYLFTDVFIDIIYLHLSVYVYVL